MVKLAGLPVISLSSLPTALAGEAHFDANLAEIGGARRPIRNGHLLDIVEIGKLRQPARPRSLEMRGEQAALADHVEQRHPVGIVQRAEQIVDQAGNEHGLARAAEPGHRQPDGGAAGKLAEVADEALGCLREDRRQPAQIHHGCHSSGILVSRFRSSPILSAHSDANFGIKGTLASL
jgi:hypothetical protein